MTRDQWRYLVDVILSPECQSALAIVLNDEIESRGRALRSAVKSADWHTSAQHLGRIDQLSEFPNLLKRYAESHKPGARE